MKDAIDYAFPVATIDGFTQSGMTLRDYFAAHITHEELGLDSNLTLERAAEMLGMSIEEYQSDNYSGWTKLSAKERYRFADAMLAERDK